MDGEARSIHAGTMVAFLVPSVAAAMALLALVRDAVTQQPAEGSPVVRIGSITEVETLPADTARVRLGGIDDEIAAGLGQKTRLSEITIGDATGMTDAGFAALVRLPRLRTLRVDYGTSLTTKGLRALVGSRSLQELRFAHMPLDKDAVRIIGKLPGLVSLQLARVTGFDDDAAAAIAGCATLRRLRVEGTRPSAAAIAHFTELRDLEELFLGGPEALDDALVARIALLQKLESLSIGGEHVTSDGLRPLGELRALRHLVLSRCGVDAPALLHLPVSLRSIALVECARLDSTAATNLRDRFPELERLHLDDCAWLHDAEAKVLLQAPRLAHLVLVGAPLTPGCFADVAKAAKLQRVEFQACEGITKADADTLRAMRPGLEVVVP